HPKRGKGETSRVEMPRKTNKRSDSTRRWQVPLEDWHSSRALMFDSERESSPPMAFRFTSSLQQLFYVGDVVQKNCVSNSFDRLVPAQPGKCILRIRLVENCS